MIILEVNGTEFTNFNSIEVNISLDTLSGSFRFDAFTDSVNPFPIEIDSPCRVLVDGVAIITGFIEIISVNYDTGSHNISIEGRDKTGDVIDSTLDGGVDFNGPISLQAIIEQILVKAKIPDIKVINEVDDIDDFTASEKVSGEIGITVFNLIEGYCRKRQVLITSDGDGNIVITRGSGISTEATLFNTLDTPELNNIKSASVTYDNSKRFNRYIVKSQLNSVGNKNLLSVGVNTVTVTNSFGQSEDLDIRESRTLVMIAEKASTSGDCKKRATWQANINRSRSFSYEVTLQGHTDSTTGEIWQPNMLIQIRDVFSGLEGQFLINSVTFRLDIDDGNVVTLGIVNTDAYTLEATEPVKQKRTTTKTTSLLLQ